MGPEKLEKILGFRSTGTCASCSRDENVHDLPTAEASALFKGTFNVEIKADGVNQLMFYRGALYAISFSISGDQRNLLNKLTSKFGKAKKDSIKAEGISQLSTATRGRDKKTIMTLELYPQQGYSATLYVSDKSIQSEVDTLEPYEKVDCK